MFSFSAEEKAQIQAHGSEMGQVEIQLENFKKGFPYLALDRAATVGDGIIQLSDQQLSDFLKQYETNTSGKELLKFVPASGAATRMFKELFEYLSSGVLNTATEKFIEGIENFAFYPELAECLKKQGHELGVLVSSKKYEPIVRALLNDDGLGYGRLPKGLLSFHKFEEKARTPIEEHLIEGAKYAASENGQAHLHFTVSPEHQAKFEEKLESVLDKYEKALGVKYNVSFSQQKKSTDTIAVDLSNKPFLENGKLLFRPAGHGALLENLNDLDADVIFVKNIDNVVPDHLKEDTIIYKKALASLLITFQSDSFDWQKRIENGEDCFGEAREALKTKYGIELNLDDTKALAEFLNRPVRVCGMVKNTGEPGGGPFWVKDGKTSSLQIAETAQVDLANTVQAAILKNSSHFNPVDLVCGVRNLQGEKFDLLQFRDDNAGFITQKSRGGKDVKAMELPGLWNGAMADWITLFVEVPISTFNPVKTVNDLLKPTHQ